MRKAIVMGASSGMGARVATLLLQRGWMVGLAARRGDKLNCIAQQYPRNAVTSIIDVTSENAPEQLLKLIESIGGVDMYFHASGIGWRNDALDAAKEIRTAQTNGTGFIRMITTAFNYMAAHGGGHIACISSIASTRGLGAAPAYSATKALQNTYIEALAQLSHTRRLGISLTDIRPGFVDTPLLGGDHYPLLMRTESVAPKILRAAVRHKAVYVVDWRWSLLTRLWQCIPHCLWRHIKL